MYRAGSMPGRGCPGASASTTSRRSARLSTTTPMRAAGRSLAMARAQESAAAISARRGRGRTSDLPDSHRQAVELPQRRAGASSAVNSRVSLRRELDESYDQDRRRFCPDDCGLRRDGIGRLRDVRPRRAGAFAPDTHRPRRHNSEGSCSSPCCRQLRQLSPPAPHAMDMRPRVGCECSSGTAHVGERRPESSMTSLPQRDRLRRAQ